MIRVVAYCGIVCSDCPVLVATQKNDSQERQKVAAMFTKQYEKEYKPEDINCSGCIAEGPHVFSFCGVCKIRKCARERKIENCAFCLTYPCGMISELHNAYPRAKDTLDEVRRNAASPRT